MPHPLVVFLGLLIALLQFLAEGIVALFGICAEALSAVLQFAGEVVTAFVQVAGEAMLAMLQLAAECSHALLDFIAETLRDKAAEILLESTSALVKRSARKFLKRARNHIRQFGWWPR